MQITWSSGDRNIACVASNNHTGSQYLFPEALLIFLCKALSHICRAKVLAEGRAVDRTAVPIEYDKFPLINFYFFFIT